MKRAFLLLVLSVALIALVSGCIVAPAGRGRGPGLRPAVIAVPPPVIVVPPPPPPY